MATRETPGDGLKQSLGRALEHRNRRKHRDTAKQRKALKKPKTRNGVSALNQAIVDTLVTPETQGKGDYRVVDFKLQEVVEGGKVKTKTSTVVRNLASTTIERWQSRGKLDERQHAAILFFQERHRLIVGAGPKVIASYAAAIAKGSTNAEENVQRVVAAREAIRLIENEIFCRRPLSDKEVWLNVVIWDEPAGVAGSRAGFYHKAAEGVALHIVRGIAHEIADLVIDNNVRKDFAKEIRALDQINLRASKRA